MSEEQRTYGEINCDTFWGDSSSRPKSMKSWEDSAAAVIAEDERRHPEKAMAGELAENLEHLLMAIEGNKHGDEDAAYYLFVAKDTSSKLLSRLDAARKGQPVPHHCPAIAEMNERLHERTQGGIAAECRVREELRIERARCQNYRAENTEMHRRIAELEEAVRSLLNLPQVKGTEYDALMDNGSKRRITNPVADTARKALAATREPDADPEAATESPAAGEQAV